VDDIPMEFNKFNDADQDQLKFNWDNIIYNNYLNRLK